MGENGCEDPNAIKINIADLEIIWTEFCAARDEKEKIELATNFLFHYQLLRTQRPNDVESSDFISSVPSQISCYLLQLVYEIICNAVGSGDANIDWQMNNHFFSGEIQPSMLVLNAPSDITAIISLREFLTRGLGRAILEFLSECDAPLITCKRELASLLINLFPSSNWDNTGSDVFKPREPMNYKNHTDQFVLMTNQRSDTSNGAEDFNKIPHYENRSNFVSKHVSSEWHAFILIDILMKLIRTEFDQNLDEKSVTVEVLRFALDTLNSPLYNTVNHDNEIPFSKSTWDILKLRIMSLFISCLNNLFCKENFRVIGLKRILSDLQNLLNIRSDEDSQSFQDAYERTFNALVAYILFGFIFNTISMFTCDKREHYSTEVVKVIGQNDGENLTKSLKDILKCSRELRNQISRDIINTILLIINDNRNPNPKDTLQKRRARKKVLNRLKQNSKQFHCKELEEKRSLCCYLEHVVFEIFNLLSIESQILISKHCLKGSICCCSYNMKTIRNLTRDNRWGPVERQLYRFFRRNILQTLYGIDTKCTLCKRSAASVEFVKDLRKFYIEKYLSISSEQERELGYLLKHLLKIPSSVSVKILEGALTSIVLPVFHEEMQKEKYNLKNSRNLTLCLQIFISYLNDCNLHEIFFTRTSATYLEILLYIPEFVDLAGSLLKIGLSNIALEQFDSNDENDKVNFNMRLINIILDANLQATRIVGQMCQRLNSESSFYVQNTSHNCCENVIKSRLADGTLKISQLLYLTVTYWNLTLDLCYYCEQFKKELFQNFDLFKPIEVSQTAEDKNSSELLQFVGNVLSCFLNHQLKCGPTTSKNALMESTLTTLNDFCIVSSDDIYYSDNFLDQKVMSLDFASNVLYDELNLAFNTLESSSSLSSAERRIPLAVNSRDSSYQHFDQVTDRMFDHLNCFTNNSYSHQNDLMARLQRSDIIFDIRNQNQSSGNFKECNENDVIAVACEDTKTESEHVLSASLYKVSSIFLNSVSFLFGSVDFYDKTNVKNLENVGENRSDEIDFIGNDTLKCLQTSNYCKRKLLKMFTSSLATAVLNCTQDRNMQLLIRQLRNLLIPHSKELWSDVENAEAIVQVLHCLLKVAETTSIHGDNEQHSNSRSRQHMTTASQDIDLDSSSDEFATANDRLEDEQDESEADATESDTEEVAIGTDEGYEADAEILGLSDSSSGEKYFFNRYSPSSSYRKQIANEGLCNLVVETLIELSEQCIKQPEFWVNDLTVLTKRLFLIRGSLGGTFFLLRGFSKVLSLNDSRLKDFQQAILDLITDLRDPDSLTAYFNILAAENPPVEILLQHITHICNGKIGVTPYTALQFPVQNDKIFTESNFESAKNLQHDNIRLMRRLYEMQEIDSIFNRSACFIPISKGIKPWSEEGFTLSTWLQIKGITSITTKSVSENSKSPSRDCEETHIMSFGTQQLVISLFINASNNLIVEFNHPAADITPRRTTANTTKSRTSQSQNEIPLNEIFSSDNSGGRLCQMRRKRKLEKSESCVTPKSPTSLSRNPERNFSGDVDNGKTSFKRAFQSTTLAILNSFSNFHLFLLQNQSENVLHGARIESDSLRLPDLKWTHLCVSVHIKAGKLNLSVILDGTVTFQFDLPWNGLNSLNKKSFEMLSLGEMWPENVEQLCDEHEYVSYRISSTMVFKKALTGGVLANLTSLGPECSHLVYCQTGNNIPNYGLLNYNFYANLEIDPLQESLKILRSNLILSHSAYDPTFSINYTHGESGPNMGQRQEILVFTKLSPTAISSIQNAAYMCGGLACFQILFARTVELTTKPEIQANALNILLRVALTDNRLYTEFVKRDTISLISSVIKTSQCSKSVHLLRAILNNACNLPICTQRNGGVQLIESVEACIVYPQLLVNIIKRYSDWSGTDSTESDVLDMLLECIKDLAQDKQVHQSYNILQFVKSGLIRELLNLCKIYLVESPNPVYLSKESASLFVSILNVFAGAPPSPSLLDEITKLLLILQKPNECYVTDNRTKFYFLLTAEKPTRQRRIGLPLKSKSFRISSSIRNRTKSASDSSSFQSRGEVKSTKCEHYATRHAKKDRLDGFAPIRLINDMKALEEITNCTGIGERKFCRVRKEHQERFRQFLLNLKKKQLVESQSRRDHIRKIVKKKILRLTPSKTSKGSSRSRHNSSKCAEDERITAKDFEIIHSDEISSLEELNASHSRGILKFSRTDVYQTPGVVAIQNGLFQLLRDFLLILPDCSIEEVLSHYVKLEIILVLANHKSSTVRTSIVRLLIVLCDRLMPSELQTATKRMYWFHLANQLSLHPVDEKLAEICIQWVTKQPTFSINFEELNRNQPDLKIQNKIGLHTLLAIAPQTVANCNLTANVFKVLDQIYKTDVELNVFMIENGLIQSAVKTLNKMYLEVKISYQIAEDSVKALLMSIAEKSLYSSGHINILWELLNILTYYVDSSFSKVICGFRKTQAHILLSLLQVFLLDDTKAVFGSTMKTKELHLAGSHLSNSEARTRFEMLIDRSIQFFISSNNTHHPSDIEIKLFELMITLSVSGISRCGNLISWGLAPIRVDCLKNCVIKILHDVFEQIDFPVIVCDLRMLNAFLWKYKLSMDCVNGDCSSLLRLCRRLGVTENDSWNLEEFLDKIDSNRANCLAEQLPVIEKALYKFESYAQICMDSAMAVTRTVADLQNGERKHLMNLMRQYDESYLYAEWRQIIQRMTHPGTPWYCSSQYPRSWELDDTEGPSRIRTRLNRCRLDIDPRFIMPEFQENYHVNQRKNPPLKYLTTSHDQQVNFSLNAQILFNFPAKFLPVDGEIDGELIVTDEKIFFAATHRCQFFYISSFIDNITEIWIRRYQHQENAMELFINSNKSFFFVIENADDRAMLREIFADKIVTGIDPIKLMQQWKEGRLTNWEYLMALNQIAGRTYNDLMQYPVFPWILADYTSSFLDLTRNESFRKLERPIAVQHDENAEHYISNYSYMNTSMTNLGSWQMKPYHYSSHYSNSGTVLHFLVRIPRFTNYFLRYQDNNFDIPDRTFHSLSTTWNLASKDSPTDVKELIPEFFCLPEMFENFESFNFGLRQNGEIVNHVQLPPWCSNNPRLFVLIHRQAFESEMVRKNLHHWIDLIFGYKQTGQPAVDAINVFHPATYAEFDFANISDPIERQAFQTMIKTYGQMPRQLFRSAHESSNELIYSPHQPSVITSVKGLRWGVFTGSPQLEEPKICYLYKQADFPYMNLVSVENRNIIYGLTEKTSIMLGTDSDYNIVSWQHDDTIIRIQSLNENNYNSKSLAYDDPADPISCCGSHYNSNVLWFGHKSGKISVYHCTNHDAGKNNKNRSNNSGIKLSYNSAFRKISSKLPSSRLEEYELLKDNKACKHDLGMVHWSGPTILICHTDEVTAICISMEFKIVVSIAKDGLAVIWDLNSLNYIRTIDRPSEIRHSPLNIVAISPTLGDIFTVHSIETSNSERKPSVPTDVEEECFEVTEENLGDFVNVSVNFTGQSVMRLHSINAKYVNHIVQEDRILSACYSYIKEGVGVNVIATGFQGGIVKLWSSWDLSLIRKIIASQSDIISIIYSTYQHLIVMTKDYIQVWDSIGLHGEPPKFPQI